jgi:hypothetical protein
MKYFQKQRTWLLLAFLVVVINIIDSATLHNKPIVQRRQQNNLRYQSNVKQINHHNRLERRSEDFDGKTVYLLVSTSSKLYCMRLLNLSNAQDSSMSIDKRIAQRNLDVDYLKNYEIIYEEKGSLTSWITDAFYVKSENLIYVNVYNSSAATSQILTLKYDQSLKQWVKTVLYKDQSYCLGIAYNENKKELYWTAARSIVSGSSLEIDKPRQLFNLDLAKKLLYLKYDSASDTIFVSTLNYVYACSMRQIDVDSDCKIIVRDLQSARGMYLDSANRFLYVVDHKRRNIKRVKLPQVDDSNNLSVSSNYAYLTENYDQSVSMILSSEIMPDLGDIFYVTLFKNMLIWSEFSGKIKVSNLNDKTNYATIFSTSEYIYSVNIMDNSTMTSLNPSTTSTSSKTAAEESSRTSSTTIPPRTSTYAPGVEYSDEVDVYSKEEQNIVTIPTTAEQPPASWIRNRISSNIVPRTNKISTIIPTTPITNTEEIEEEVEEDEKDLISTSDLNNSIVEDSDDKYGEDIETTTIAQIATHTPPNRPKFIQKDASSQELVENENFKNTKKDNQIQNLKASNIKPSISTSSSSSSSLEEKSPALVESSSFNLVKGSPKLSLALYIVIGLLCFSLVINVALLYLNKLRQRNREKLIIRHEICSVNPNKTGTGTLSQHSGLTNSKMSSNSGADINECNNLINSSGSATSHLDIEQ